MRFEFSLCASDRDRFGGPEWIVFNEDSLADVTAQTLERWEQPILDTYGITLLDVVNEATSGKTTMRSLRAMLWIGYQQAGVDIAYDEFAPRLMDPSMRVKVDAGDVDPPAEAGPSSLDSSPEPANSVDDAPPQVSSGVAAIP